MNIFIENLNSIVVCGWLFSNFYIYVCIKFLILVWYVFLFFGEGGGVEKIFVKYSFLYWFFLWMLEIFINMYKFLFVYYYIIIGVV